MHMGVIEWIGYAAFAITAASMLMSSVLKLRWYLLVGGVLFTAYGLAIGAYPVALLNSFIAVTNTVYLAAIYSRKEYFKILEVRKTNNYLRTFVEINEKGIRKYFPRFSYKPEEESLCFFILRNLTVAGVFMGHALDGETLCIDLDYVITEYRDFKLGRYIFARNEAFFLEHGYMRICSPPQSKSYDRYLSRMGFTQQSAGGERLFVKELGGVGRADSRGKKAVRKGEEPCSTHRMT